MGCAGGEGCEEQAVVQPRRCWAARTKQMFDVGMIPSDLLTLPLPSDLLTLPLPSDLLTLPLPSDLLTLPLPSAQALDICSPPVCHPLLRFPDEQQLHYACLMLRDVGNLGSPYRRWGPPAADLPHSSLAADERLKRPLRPAGA